MIECSLCCQLTYNMDYAKQENLHWVSGSYVFAGCLYYRFTGFIQSSIDAVIGTRVSLLNQCLKLDEGKLQRKKKSLRHHKRAVSCHHLSAAQSGTSQCTLTRLWSCHWPSSRIVAKYFLTGFSTLLQVFLFMSLWR